MSKPFQWNMNYINRRQAQKEDLIDVLDALGGGRVAGNTPVNVVRALLRGRVDDLRAGASIARDAAPIQPGDLQLHDLRSAFVSRPCTAEAEERYEGDPLNASPAYG